LRPNRHKDGLRKITESETTKAMKLKHMEEKRLIEGEAQRLEKKKDMGLKGEGGKASLKSRTRVNTLTSKLSSSVRIGKEKNTCGLLGKKARGTNRGELTSMLDGRFG